MRDHAISTAGCSVMAPTIMSVSMAKGVRTPVHRNRELEALIMSIQAQRRRVINLKVHKEKGWDLIARRPAAQIKLTGFYGVSGGNSAVRH